MALICAAPALTREKGGEDETGPYEVAAGWPQPWSKAGYIWGSQPAVFAQSPDRVSIGARGELKLPETLPRGFNGIWGSLGQRATEPKAEVQFWEPHQISIDSEGNLYIADSFGGRTQKYAPAKAGDRSRMLRP